MFEFVGKFVDKEKALSHYESMAKEALSDGVIDDKEEKALNQLVEEHNLKDNDLVSHKRNAFHYLFSELSKDQIISSDDKKKLEDLLKYFNLTNTQAGLDQAAFNKYYMLGLIQEGQLPNVSDQFHEVILRPGEIVHWAAPSTLVKHKSITRRVNFSGPVASIRIMKGLRYRVGSYKVSTARKDYLVPEDAGMFWISSQRIGFKGQRKDFAFPITKVLSFELSPDGLLIAKEGRENPYIVQMKDYEVILSVISFLLNR